MSPHFSLLSEVKANTIFYAEVFGGISISVDYDSKIPGIKRAITNLYSWDGPVINSTMCLHLELLLRDNEIC